MKKILLTILFCSLCTFSFAQMCYCSYYQRSGNIKGNYLSTEVVPVGLCVPGVDIWGNRFKEQNGLVLTVDQFQNIVNNLVNSINGLTNALTQNVNTTNQNLTNQVTQNNLQIKTEVLQQLDSLPFKIINEEIIQIMEEKIKEDLIAKIKRGEIKLE